MHLCLRFLNESAPETFIMFIYNEVTIIVNAYTILKYKVLQGRVHKNLIGKNN